VEGREVDVDEEAEHPEEPEQHRDGGGAPGRAVERVLGDIFAFQDGGTTVEEGANDDDEKNRYCHINPIGRSPRGLKANWWRNAGAITVTAMSTPEASSHSSPYARFGKPVLDRVLGLVLAVLTLPVVLVLLFLSWSSFGWPPLARLPRVGRNRQTFNLFRVNTEKTNGTDLRGRPLRLSRRLRSTSLDELPQLWNVVLGHMSLVGPRPLHLGQETEVDQAAGHRHRTRPGVTGPWQVTARGDGRSLADDLTIDLNYLENLSLKRDLGILARTLPALLRDREEV